MFQAAKQNRIFQDVVDQIQENILSGKLEPGDILPPERELKDMFHVSRGTLREALRVLEQKGLIEIKLGIGGGALVKDVNYDQVTESLALLIQYKKVSLHHLAEFREGVEGRVAGLAAKRAGKEDIKRLEVLLNQAESYMHKGKAFINEFIKIDKKIHLALAEISKNPVYISIQKTIHDNIDRYFKKFLFMDEPELMENLKDLKDIIHAVKKGDVQNAKSLACKHILKFNHYMETSNRT